MILAEIDLDDTKFGKSTVFDFGRHRRIEHYGLITQTTGVVGSLDKKSDVSKG